MNNFARWVDALESGDYVQTKGQLRKDNDDGTSCFCVAGVACELALADGVDLRWDPRIQAYLWHTENCDCGCDEERDMQTNISVPAPVKEWLGMKRVPKVLLDARLGIEADVVSVNDSSGWSFARIAEGLRERYAAELGV